jgi:intracellular sulfur oxidation DsrE/DsrF family protein
VKHFVHVMATFFALAAGVILAVPANAADAGKEHRIAIQIDQNNPQLMNLVLNNVANLVEYYNGKGEKVQIDVTAYGPGLNMLRADKSPVKDRIKRIKDGSFPSTVRFSACHNTIKGMEKKEGHAISVIPEATVVPAGVVHLSELQEQGWSYIRP